MIGALRLFEVQGGVVRHPPTPLMVRPRPAGDHIDQHRVLQSHVAFNRYGRLGFGFFIS